MSASFKDRTGREFNCVVTVAEAERLKKELQVDIGDIGDGKLFERLTNDWGAMVSVAWIVCQESIIGHKIESPEEFGRAFDGDALGAAFDAFWEAVTDFYPTRRRSVLREMIEKTRQAETATVEMVAGRIAKMDVTKIAEEALISFDSAGSKPQSEGSP